MTNVSLVTKVIYNVYYYYDFNTDVIIQLKDNSFVILAGNEILRFNKVFKPSLSIYFKNLYNSRSIKQLNNNKIYFCNKYLYQIDIKINKIIKIPFFKNDDINIYDIIELDNGKIIGVTDEFLLNILLFLCVPHFE